MKYVLFIERFGKALAMFALWSNLFVLFITANNASESARFVTYAWSWLAMWCVIIGLTCITFGETCQVIVFRRKRQEFRRVVEEMYQEAISGERHKRENDVFES